MDEENAFSIWRPNRMMAVLVMCECSQSATISMYDVDVSVYERIAGKFFKRYYVGPSGLTGSMNRICRCAGEEGYAKDCKQESRPFGAHDLVSPILVSYRVLHGA